MRIPYYWPEWTFILCVNVLPLLAALVLASRGGGFCFPWIASTVGGVLVWLVLVGIGFLVDKRR